MFVRTARLVSRPLNTHAARSSSTVATVIREAATEFPHREVVKDIREQVAWSNADLVDHTNALAEGLGQLSFTPGSTIITLMPSSVESLVTTLAAASLGVRVIPATSQTAGELQSLLTSTAANAVIFSPTANDVIESLLPEVFAKAVMVKDFERLSDARFPHLDMVATTHHEQTNSGVINFRHLFMFDYTGRSSVERAQSSIESSTPLLGNLTNQDIIAQAGGLHEKIDCEYSGSN